MAMNSAAVAAVVVTAAAAEARADAAGAGRRPQIGLGAGYDYARPNPRIFPRAEEWQDSWDVSVTVAWALWDGGRTRAERAEAADEHRLGERADVVEGGDRGVGETLWFPQ